MSKVLMSDITGQSDRLVEIIEDSSQKLSYLLTNSPGNMPQYLVDEINECKDQIAIIDQIKRRFKDQTEIDPMEFKNYLLVQMTQLACTSRNHKNDRELYAWGQIARDIRFGGKS